MRGPYFGRNPRTAEEEHKAELDRMARDRTQICKWCADGPPEWSYHAKVWIHRRERLDRACENPPNNYGYTTQVPEETISSQSVEAEANTILFWDKIQRGAVTEVVPPLCPDSPDGNHHVAPIGSNEEWLPSKAPCHYCGDKQTEFPRCCFCKQSKGRQHLADCVQHGGHECKVGGDCQQPPGRIAS